MPEHIFICDDCEIIVKDTNTKIIHVCPKCGKDMRWDLKGIKVGNKTYVQPLHSDSLAINPNQISEHRRLFPDIEIDNQGRPVFTNFKQHDSYLEKTGFIKQTQKIRRILNVNSKSKTCSKSKV